MECVQHDLLGSGEHCLLPCPVEPDRSRDAACGDVLDRADAECVDGYCVVVRDDPEVVPPFPTPERSYPGFGSPAWSASDGVLSGVKDDSVYVFDGDETVLFLEERGARGKWAPSGDAYGYFDDDDFVVVDSSGEERTRVKGLNEVCGWAWSPDGDRIVSTLATDDGSELRVFDLEGQERFSTASLDGARKCSPSWSPDGERLYFVSKAPPGDEFETPEPLLVLHVDDDFGYERIAKGSTSSYTGTAHEGDGFYYFVSSSREDGTANVLLHRVDGEPSEASPLSYDEGTGVDAAWSPQSPILALATWGTTVELRLVHAPSGTSVAVYAPVRVDSEGTEGPTGFRSVSWSPDGESLSYVVQSASGEALHVLSVAEYLDELLEHD